MMPRSKKRTPSPPRMTEEEFTVFMDICVESKGKKKFFYLSDEMAAAARAGEIETEHFILKETRPNVFELVEK